jgi:two-component system, response regulator RegA
MRVLVVDDDAAALEIRRLVIERRGHSVTIAHNAAEAREGFARGCDAVVLDLRLPEVEDGLSLMREFRYARVIVLCGNRNDLDGREEAQLAAVILEKPVRSEVLVDAINRPAAS